MKLRKWLHELVRRASSSTPYIIVIVVVLLSSGVIFVYYNNYWLVNTLVGRAKPLSIHQQGVDELLLVSIAYGLSFLSLLMLVRSVKKGDDLLTLLSAMLLFISWLLVHYAYLLKR